MAIHRTSRRIHRSSRAALLVASVALVAACGDDDKTSSSDAPTTVETSSVETTTGSTDTTTASTDTTVEGGSDARFPLIEAPKSPASGEPIVIGWTNIDEGPLTFPEFTEGFEAAVKFVNDRGGIQGRPIEVVKCPLSVSPESSQNCAVKINEAQPLVAMGGLDFARGNLYNLLAASGTPAAGGLPATPDDFAAKNTYFYYNGAFAQYVTSAAFAVQELGGSKVAVMDSNTPAALANINQYFIPAAEGIGATVTHVSEDPSAPDFTAQASQIIDSSPDVVLLSTSGTACVGSITSLRSLGYEGPILMAATCSGATVFNSIDPSVMHDVYYISEFYDVRAIANLEGAAQQEVQAYLDAMAEYAPDASLAEFTQVGFAALMNVVQVLQSLPADQLTTAGVSAAFAAQKDAPNFMSNVYTCDGTAVPGQPSQCASSAVIYDWNGGDPKVASDGFIDANSVG